MLNLSGAGPELQALVTLEGFRRSGNFRDRENSTFGAAKTNVKDCLKRGNERMVPWEKSLLPCSPSCLPASRRPGNSPTPARENVTTTRPKSRACRRGRIFTNRLIRIRQTEFRLGYLIHILFAYKNNNKSTYYESAQMKNNLHRVFFALNVTLNFFVILFPSAVFADLPIVGSLDTPCQAWRVKIIAPYAYIADGCGGVVIADIRNPRSPLLVKVVEGGYPVDIDVSGSYAYIADSHYGFRVLDVGDPANPTFVKQIQTGYCYGVQVSDNFVYTANGINQDNVGGGLSIIDITNPTDPYILSTLSSIGEITRIYVHDGYAFVGDSTGGFKIIDIRDSSNPCVVSSITCSIFGCSNISDIFVSDDYAYIADHYYGLYVFDVSNLMEPIEILNYIKVNFWIQSIAVKFPYIYIGTNSSVAFGVLNITDHNVILEDYIPSQSEIIHHAQDIDVVDGYAYLADIENGMKIIDVSEYSTICPIVAQSPMEGPPGTVFAQWGTGFTPNGTATLHFRKPDGTEYPTQSQPLDSIGHFDIQYTAPYDKPPGIYTWWAVDNATGGKSNEIQYTIEASAVNPKIAQTPMSGPPGTVFAQWGTGFTPNGTATLHFRKPDGTEYPTQSQPLDLIGHFDIRYTAPWDKPVGTYAWWAIDNSTGATSNVVSYNIEPKEKLISVSGARTSPNLPKYINSGEIVSVNVEIMNHDHYAREATAEIVLDRDKKPPWDFISSAPVSQYIPRSGGTKIFSFNFTPLFDRSGKYYLTAFAKCNINGQFMVMDQSPWSEEIPSCENMPVFLQLIGGVNELKKCAKLLATDKWSELSKLNDLSMKEFESGLKQVFDEDTLSFRKFAELQLSALQDIVNAIGGSGSYTVSPDPAGARIVYDSGAVCIAEGIDIDPFSEVFVSKGHDSAEITLTQGGLSYSFSLSAIAGSISNKGVRFESDFACDNGNHVWFSNEIYFPRFGYHTEIVIENNDLKVSLIFNDPASEEYCSAKLAGYAGCDISLYKLFGGGLSIGGEIYTDIPVILLKPSTYAEGVYDCISGVAIHSDPEDMIMASLDSWPCLEDHFVEEPFEQISLGMGIGVSFKGGVGAGGSPCLAPVQGSVNAEGGIYVDIETNPLYIDDIVGDASDLSKFLVANGFLFIKLGHLSKGDILSIPALARAFMTARNMAKKIQGQGAEYLNHSFCKFGFDWGVSGELKDIAGVDASIKRGLGGEISLDTLFSMYAFDLDTILERGYLGVSYSGAGELSAGIGPVGIKGSFSKDFVKIEIEGKNGEKAPSLKLQDEIDDISVAYVSEVGVDQDGDGSFDTLRVETGVNVNIAGTYRISGMLYSGDVCVGYVQIEDSFSTGNHTVNLNFDGLSLRNSGYDGPYTFGAMAFAADGDDPVFISDSLGVTKTYLHSDFEAPSITITDVTYAGIDTNGDGLYDLLEATVHLNAEASQEVRIEGYSLTDGTDFSASAQSTLNAGSNTATMGFDGRSIRQSGIDGPYEFRFQALDDQSELHDEFGNTTSAFAYTDFQKPDACLTNAYTDHAEDTDGDGLYDLLVVDVGLEVAQPGTYRVTANLEGENVFRILSVGKDLPTGATTLSFAIEGQTISASGMDQAYELTELILTNESTGEVLGKRSRPYQTSVYSHGDFEGSRARLTDQYASRGNDTDGNGFYESLAIETSVNVSEAGIYQIDGHLKCGDGYVVARSVEYLDKGANSIELSFDGEAIHALHYNGAYQLERVGIVHDEKYIDYSPGISHSSNHKFYDFEASYSEDSDNDGILDFDEDINRNGIVDAGETDPNKIDTDGDGIQDGTELGYTMDDIRPDTDTSIFKPDSDPSTTTDPLAVDSDNDGIPDGQEDANKNGFADPGETDATDWDTDNDNFADGDEKMAGSDPLLSSSSPCIVCIDKSGACGSCAGSFLCSTSIQGGIDYSVSNGNPYSLIKVFAGNYNESITIKPPCRLVIVDGGVNLVSE